MSTRSSHDPSRAATGAALFLALFASAAAHSQVPVDEYGNPTQSSWDVESSPGSNTELEGARIEMLGDESIPLLSARDLDQLVGPVALYPDALLAIALPAAAYPLQVVQAARFLDELESDPSLTPSPDWDESVVALLNYPEVLSMLNEDIDWTLRLGEAVIAQQTDVIAAVQRFRDRAYVAGNLRSDERQAVVHSNEIIEITPVSEDVIYVPYYEPETVVRRSVTPVYRYYPEPHPVYYYPYPDGHAFRNGFFWGVTSAYALGWRQDRLRVIHHSFRGHPYYGRHYGARWWYRRPSIMYHNRHYFRPNRATVRNRFGDYWTPRRVRHATRVHDRARAPRYSRSYPARRTTRSHTVGVAPRQRPTMGAIENSLRRENTRRNDRVRSPVATTTRRTPVGAVSPSRMRSNTIAGVRRSDPRVTASPPRATPRRREAAPRTPPSTTRRREASPRGAPPPAKRSRQASTNAAPPSSASRASRVPSQKQSRSQSRSASRESRRSATTRASTSRKRQRD